MCKCQNKGSAIARFEKYAIAKKVQNFHIFAHLLFSKSDCAIAAVQLCSISEYLERVAARQSWAIAHFENVRSLFLKYEKSAIWKFSHFLHIRSCQKSDYSIALFVALMKSPKKSVITQLHF